jgi:hypothetical protein
MVGGDAGVSGAARGHQPEFRTDLRVIGWPLRHFLIVWLITYPAMSGFATLFPVAMTRCSRHWVSLMGALDFQITPLL